MKANQNEPIATLPLAEIGFAFSVRDMALLDLAIDSKLRGCDLVKIKISDIVCNHGIRHRAINVQQKTGRPVQFEILEDARTSLLRWLELHGGSLL